MAQAETARQWDEIRREVTGQWGEREAMTAWAMHDVLTGVGANISSMTFAPNGDTTVRYELPVGRNGNRAPIELRPNDYMVAGTVFSTQDVVRTPPDRVQRRVRGEILDALKARSASRAASGRRTAVGAKA